MTNVRPWIIRILTLPSLLASSVPCIALSHLESHMVRSITHKPPYIFLKTATIPTYYGISIAIPRYIAMQIFYRFIYYDTLHHCHIALHDHVVDIVFVAKPPCILFIHVTLDSLPIPVHRRRHSYRVILCSSIEL